MAARIATIVALMSLALVSVAGTALGAPTKNQNTGDLDGSTDCSVALTWKGGWICEDEEDTGNNPGGKNNNNGWVDETETETTYKGNSGKVKTETTLHCVYNPSGNLMEKKSDPECPPTTG